MYNHLNEKVLSLSAKNATFSMLTNKDSSELNSNGFRCCEFNNRKDINVVTIGGEKSIGYGLEIQQRYSNIFCKAIEQSCGKSANDWNLSIPAKSNDYIARMALVAKRLLKPDIVLVEFLPINRREYWDRNGKCVDYLPENYNETIKKLNKEHLDAYRKIHLMRNDYEDFINFHKNFLTVSQILENIQWFFCAPSGSKELISGRNFIGNFEVYDVAEGFHKKPSYWNLPGIATNYKIAYDFVTVYSKNINATK